MNKPVCFRWLLSLGAAVSLILPGCSRTDTPTLVLAPPGPPDLGPATELSTPPANAIVFDLNYRPQTGAADDLEYRAYWGFGGATEETRTNAFIQEARTRAPRLHYEKNPNLKGREWAAVEYDRRQPVALYFDLNADGKLSENERIAPSRKADYGFDFITPDFMNPLPETGPMLCRALLRVNFYPGSSEPNCMWSPAALLESTARLDGQPVRLLLYADRPGGEFGKFGSSSFSLMHTNRFEPGRYVPRETLSSLISSEGAYYRLSIEGRRSNGLPARAILVKDTTPTGALAVTLTGSNTLQATLTSLYLHGVENKTVFIRVGTFRSNSLSLPVGAYALNSGTAVYRSLPGPAWELSFSEGPCGTIKAGETLDLALGRPALQVRAVEERHRYDRQQPGSVTFKKGARIYLEPRIIGQGHELFSRFRQSAGGASGNMSDRPPKVTITGPNGKQLLAQTMEYG